MLINPVLSNNNWSYYVYDHQGNTRVVLDESGNVKSYYDYYPYGKLQRASVAGLDARYKFTGKELDDEGGLDWTYFGARYYDPEIGRFLSVDPLADLFPDITSYHYTHNNPINRVDPEGMSDEGNDDDNYPWYIWPEEIVVTAQRSNDWYISPVPDITGWLGANLGSNTNEEFFKRYGQWYVLRPIDWQPPEVIKGVVDFGPFIDVGGASLTKVKRLAQLKLIFKNRRLLINWIKGNMSKSRIENPLSHKEAQELIKAAKEAGITKFDFNTTGLRGSEMTGEWKGIAHFKIENIHIPVKIGFNP